MGFTNIFKKFFGLSQNSESLTDQNLSLSRDIGQTSAICPYCDEHLDKMPSRKTKCPYCKNYIYKRTRPYDEANIIVREDQLEKIKEEWAIKNGTHDNYLEENARVKKVRDEMRERYGKEPSDHDVEFRVLNEQAVEAEFAGNWGFARNFRLNMAKNLEKRGSLELSLRMYFHICFLDINGPNNRGGIQTLNLDEYPYFSPDIGFLAPGVINTIKKLIDKLKFDEQSCKERFIEVTEPIHEGTPTPIPPKKAWPKLKEELFK